MSKKYDFSGWATRNNIQCSDGRTIRQDAFANNDGKTVPLVWQHQHDEPANVLGHALLENRPDGVYTYGVFNDTDAAKTAKLLVEHGDITSLSIYANQLKQNGKDVLHGVIREVSLVLSGANPGAFIDVPRIEHADESEIQEAIIYSGETLELAHEDSTKEEEKKPEEKSEDKSEEKVEIPEEKKEENPDESSETVGDVLKTFNKKQKEVLDYLVTEALKEKEDETKAEHSDGGTEEMKVNVFENEDRKEEQTLSHDAMNTIIADAKRYGSMKESVIQHSAEYGIENIEYLFPDAKTVTNAPEFIKRNDEWVDRLMKNTKHTPFSRIKSIFADLTEADARAKGFVKGNMKIEEVFGLLKRITTPTTIYKKQKLDRDDIIDITDFDVVAWLKTEMRMMLDEEIARAVLVGDGRDNSSDDKINPLNIRPIWTDDDLFTIKQKITVAAAADENTKAKAIIRGAIKARKNYKGSGNPTFFTTEDVLTDMLLMEDTTGRVIYDSVAKLATALRVKEIVTVPVMEDLTRTDSQSATRTLVGIIVNPTDYTIGADKGGSINMFDDFDIDYNQQKYLIETRCSGALVKPYSAIALEMVTV